MPQKYNQNTTATVHSHDCQELLIFIFPYKNALAVCYKTSLHP